MADILASVSVVLGAEVSQFKAEMANARKELKGLREAGEAMQNIGTSLTKAVSAPLALMATGALVASSKLEGLRNGLQAIAQQELGKQGITGLTGIQQAAQQTGERIKELQVLAKAPGLGLEAAEQADIRLRAVGTSSVEATKEIKAFANAIATTGGGKTQFELVTTQLSQMAAKGKVLANDLKPIIESAPAVAGALQKLYGTVDSETISASLTKQGQSSKDFIRILTDELAKLPQVTGGLKAVYENDMDALLVTSAKVGDGIAKALNLQSVGEDLANNITAIGDNFANLSAPAQGAIVGLAGLAAATGPVLVGLGTLGVALPAVKAGFLAAKSGIDLLGSGLAALASPTGLVIVGVAALAAGAYYLATANERALQTYRDQAKETDNLTATITPLLARYEELNGITNRTQAEQAELNSVIKQLAASVPGATAAIDQYGNATAISATAVTEFTKALQQKKGALAALNLPAASQKLQELADKYAVLKKQADEFNRTGAIKVAVFDSGGGSVEEYKAGSKAVLELQANLASANIEFLQQKQVVEGLRTSVSSLTNEYKAGLTPALSDTELALKFLGGQGSETKGLLAGLHEELKGLKQEQQDAPTAQLALAYVPLIKNLQDYISKLEGSDKASKKGADAIAKLRLELSRLTALDNLLGDTPTQLQVLERRSDALAKGLKTLVDAGVSPASRAFRGFEQDMIRTGQAADKIMAGIGKNKPKGDQLNLQPIEVKSLIPQTIGDTLPQDVARLLGDYAKKPIQLPLHLEIKPIFDNSIKSSIADGFLSAVKGIDVKGLGEPLLQYGESLRQAAEEAKSFGGTLSAMFNGFDVGAEKASAARTQLQALREGGFGALSKPVQDAIADLRQFSLESANARLLSQSLSDGAVSLGTAISSAFVNVATAGATVGQFFGTIAAGIIDTLADFAEKKAKLLIALGIADLATPGFQAIGAAELAGGIGLLAAAGIARAGSAAINTSIGSIGSAGSTATSPDIKNYGQTNNQQTIKVIAEFRLPGQDLVAVGRSQTFRSKVTD
jgi:tape measure domain-containing protein